VSSLAGSFLVAKPVIQEGNFRRTVVLLIQHSDDGAFGLVVNRPAKADGLPFPVYSGGPCESPGLLMLHGHEEWLIQEDDQPRPQVAPGIFLGDAECVQRVSEPDTEESLRFRIFVGYSGWGPKQLEGELSTGAWTVAEANGETLFETPPEQLWRNLMPPLLPEPSLN
jgi:putative transcriptional regulator